MTLQEAITEMKENGKKCKLEVFHDNEFVCWDKEEQAYRFENNTYMSENNFNIVYENLSNIPKEKYSNWSIYES